MALQLYSFNSFLQNAAAAVQASASALLDFTAGSVVRALMEACSALGLTLQYQIVQVLALARSATSNGSDLDSFMAQFFFTRLPAVAATGTVTFSRYTNTAAAFIGVGALVKTSDGTQTFIVTADPTNTAYSASLGGFTIAAGVSSLGVLVTAQTAGASANVAANSITLMGSAIAGIDTVTNAAAFTNGINAEADAAFRARFQNYINTRYGGTNAALGYAIASVQQGLTYSIAENVNVSGTTTPGTTVVYVDDGSGSPSASLLTACANAVGSISVRPLGGTVFVQGPSLVTANVTFTISVATGYTKANMLSTVSAAVTAYINALPMGYALPYSRLPQVIYDSTPGITNVTALLLNGATSDLGGGTSQVVRAGAVTVS